jgi:hypothetical protein
MDGHLARRANDGEKEPVDLTRRTIVGTSTKRKVPGKHRARADDSKRIAASERIANADATERAATIGSHGRSLPFGLPPP